MPQSKQAKRNGTAATATRRPRPATTAGAAHDALVRLLARRFAERSESPDAPLIVVNRVPRTKTVHVLVVWDRWKNVAVVDRNRLVSEAFAAASPGDRESVTFPMGLTPGEALRQGFLPYQIVPVVRRDDGVSDGEIERAMQAAGGVLLRVGDDLQLRFATRGQANEAYRRLAERINKPIWTLSEELTSAASESFNGM